MLLTSRWSRGASVTAGPDGFRLAIPASDDSTYCLAQLDNYSGLPRRLYPTRPHVTLELRARASSASIHGTWGFGFWNSPYGFSLGQGGGKFSLPALPNAAWFFHASPENHLSFCDKPGNGFLAQSFRSPAFDLRLFLAGLLLPFSRRAARRQLSRVIREEGERVQADPTGWSLYRLEWGPTRVTYDVDHTRVMETPLSPHPPLGVVIWIDNQFAAFTPEGKIAAGVLANAQPAWIEIADLRLTV
ncbi:MAG: hypothetical protein HFACDABA_03112 [Anaerolineales bacterium]|nr:hypothetical protein [Anaerolineales bacterium]